LVAAAAKRLRSIEGPANPQKSEAKPVTSGRDAEARKGFVRAAVFSSAVPRARSNRRGSARPPRLVHGGVPWFSRPVRPSWLHIGIDNVDGLEADLHRGIAALKAADGTRFHQTICVSDLPLHRGRSMRAAKSTDPYKSGFCGRGH